MRYGFGSAAAYMLARVATTNKRILYTKMKCIVVVFSSGGHQISFIYLVSAVNYIAAEFSTGFR